MRLLFLCGKSFFKFFPNKTNAEVFPPPKKIVSKFYAAFRRGRTSAFVTLFSPDKFRTKKCAEKNEVDRIFPGQPSRPPTRAASYLKLFLQSGKSHLQGRPLFLGLLDLVGQSRPVPLPHVFQRGKQPRQTLPLFFAAAPQHEVGKLVANPHHVIVKEPFLQVQLFQLPLGSL